jgi:hypothetical protein
VTDMQAVVLWIVVCIDRCVNDYGVPGCYTLQCDMLNCPLCIVIFHNNGVFSITAVGASNIAETYVLGPSLFWKLGRWK